MNTNTAALIQQYMPQIKEIAAYAVATGFDIETGNFDTLVENWHRSQNAFYTEILENKTDRAKKFRNDVFEMAKNNILS